MAGDQAALVGLHGMELREKQKRVTGRRKIQNAGGADGAGTLDAALVTFTTTVHSVTKGSPVYLAGTFPRKMSERPSMLQK
jgi:hypothetical protein